MYLKEVARGKKGSKHLSYAEAKDVAQYIVTGRATDAQIGAFLIAQRVKGETVDELLAFVHAVQQSRSEVEPSWNPGLDVVGPSDGRSHSFLATVGSSAVLASLGIPVLMQSPDDALPPKQGVTIWDIMEHMGATRDLPPNSWKEIYCTTGLAAFNPEYYYPPLGRLHDLRRQLGVRTLLNTVDKCLNPSRNTAITTGVFHAPQLERLSQLFLTLGYKKALVVQGTEGSEDLPTHIPATLWIVSEGTIRQHRIDPRHYHLRSASNRYERLSAEAQAELLFQVLGGSPIQPYFDLVVYNAAVRLWFMGRTQTIDQGITLAIQSLRSQHAFRVWQHLRQITHSSGMNQESV